jgi:hypothetical protein
MSGIELEDHGKPMRAFVFCCSELKVLGTALSGQIYRLFIWILWVQNPFSLCRISLTLMPFFTLHIEIWSCWAQNLFLAEKELESRYFLRYCLHHCSLTSASVEVYLWIIMQWEGCHLPLRSMFCFWCKLWLYAYYTFA